MSVEFHRGSPRKFDSRTLNRKTLNRWTGRTSEGSRKEITSGSQVVVFPCIHTCIYIYIYTYICAYIYIYIYINNNNNNSCTKNIYIYKCTYNYMYGCMYVWMYVCVYTYIYIYIYMCIYIYIYYCTSEEPLIRLTPETNRGQTASKVAKCVSPRSA